MSDLNLILRSGKPLAVPVGVSSSGFVGEVKESAGFQLEPGYLWCDGAEYSCAAGSDYYTLAQKVGGAYTSLETANFGATNGSSLIDMLRSGPFIGTERSPTVGDIVFTSISQWLGLDLSDYPGLDWTGIPLYVVSWSGTQMQFSDTPGGTPLVSTFTTASPFSPMNDFQPTFRVPRRNGRIAVGRDDMGSLGDEDTFSGNGFDATVLGNKFGAERHQITIAEMAAHSHTVQGANHTTRQNGGSSAASDATKTSSTVGGNQPHNNVQPSMVSNFVIRYY